MRGRLLFSFLLFAVAADGGPKPETVQAFNRYVRRAEARIEARIASDGYLWAGTPERRAHVRQAGAAALGEALGGGSIKVPQGLVHDWAGAIFIPGAALGRVLALVQDYDRHAALYRPDVIASRLVERSGGEFRVRLRLKRKQVRTVVLDTEHLVEYAPSGDGSWTSRSYSTRIAEIANAGGTNERELKDGEDHGYLWRLNSYWTFREQDGGVYIECEAISLSRGIPAPFAFVLKPIVRNLPREALLRTLRATRSAVLAGGG